MLVTLLLVTLFVSVCACFFFVLFFFCFFLAAAPLVKPIPFQPNDPSVSGPDIFQRLIPMEAHTDSSLYRSIYILPVN